MVSKNNQTCDNCGRARGNKLECGKGNMCKFPGWDDPNRIEHRHWLPIPTEAPKDGE